MDRQEFLTYSEAKKFIKRYNLTSRGEFFKFIRSHDLKLIPKDPSHTFRQQWKGWGDFLGTDNEANMKRVFVSYNKAKEIVQKLGLKSMTQWKKWSKTKRPYNIPSNPNKHYKKEWTDWWDFFGTNKGWPPFQEAREIVRKYNLKNILDFRLKRRRIKELQQVPLNADLVYS